MGAAFEFLKPGSLINKSRWAAVRVLGVAALALGAALIYIETQPEEPQFDMLSVFAPVSVPTPLATVPVGNVYISGQKKASDSRHLCASSY